MASHETIAVIEITANVAHDNGGVVRPSDVYNEHRANPVAHFDISMYRVRETFKGMATMGILTFHGNHYKWNPESILFANMRDANRATDTAGMIGHS